MKPSEIYAKAAQRIERGESSRACWAIQEVLNESRLYDSRLRAEYVDRVLCGEEATWVLYDSISHEKAQEIRALSLCFMAAIAADEERAKLRSRR